MTFRRQALMTREPHATLVDMKNDGFGGILLRYKRKSKRPLDFKKSMHLVLRLRENLPNLLSPRAQILRAGFLKCATKYNIRVYDLVFNHSHVHASILIPERKAYVAFIREWTSRLALYFSKITRIKIRKLFEYRPYTRIVRWGRAFQALKKYMQKNEAESGVRQLEQRPRKMPGHHP